MLTEIPKLEEGIVLTAFDSADSKLTTLLRSPHGRSWKIAPAMAEVIQAIDGQRTTAEIISHLVPDSNPEKATQVQSIIWNDLRGMGLLQRYEATTASPRSSLALRVPLIPAVIVRFVSLPLTVLYRPFVFVSMSIVVFVLQLFWLTTGRWTRPETPSSSVADTLFVALLVALSYLLHEFGHTTACQRFGVNPGEIGFGFYWLFPVSYANVSSAWGLRRNQRAVVDIGGLYFQLLFISGLMLLSIFHPQRLLTTAILLCELSLLPNLDPFIKMDGYWLLSDLTGVSNLSLIFKDWMSGRNERSQSLPASSRRILTVYSWLTVLFISGFFLRLSVEMPSFIGQTVQLARDVMAARHLSTTAALVIPLLLHIALLGLIAYSAYSLLQFAGRMTVFRYFPTKGTPHGAI